MPNFYRLLEIRREASASEIKKAYKKAALKFHPDKNPDDTEEANKRFREISEAFYVLSDDRKRRAYDERYYRRKFAYEQRTYATYCSRDAAVSREKSAESDSFHFNFEKDKTKPYVMKFCTTSKSVVNCKVLTTKIEMKDGNVIFLQYEDDVLKSKSVNGVQQKMN